MKNSIYLFIIMGLMFTVTLSCDKEDESGTNDNVPVLTTNEVTEITQTSAVSGGNITDNGGSAITEKGVVWSTSANPTLGTNDGITYDGTGDGSITSNLTQLNPETQYYVRAYATNSNGTGFGSEMSFTTLEATNVIIDANDNVYQTVIIGNQEWMAENLKTTKYNDGTDIPGVTDNSEWSLLNSGAFSWFENDYDTYGIVYGALYNWYAVNTGILCPIGWHVATDEEWKILTDYLVENTGGKLKATGTTSGGDGLWFPPNDGATNETGFEALPGGQRLDAGEFFSLGIEGRWWSATEFGNLSGNFHYIRYNSVFVNKDFGRKQSGYSVRCIRDGV